MCEQLGKIRQALAAYSASFDAGLLSVADARAVLREVTAIEHVAVAVKAMAAARAFSADQRPGSQRLAAEQLAELTGSTLGAATDTLAVGRRLEEQPDVAAAAMAGALSDPQLKAITDGVAANPDAARRLLEKAATGSLAELRDESARVKAAAQPDPDRRRAEIRAGRNFRSWTDAGGVGHISAAGNVEDIAQITAAVRSVADDIFRAARLRGQREPSQAYEFDALVQLAMAATSPTAPTSSDRTDDAAMSPVAVAPDGPSPDTDADRSAARTASARRGAWRQPHAPTTPGCPGEVVTEGRPGRLPSRLCARR